MNDLRVRLRFGDLDLAAANQAAQSLAYDLSIAEPSVKVTREKSDSATMDFGATLVLVLGTPAVVAVAKAIKVWLEQNGSSTLIVETPHGKVLADHLASKDVGAIVRALQESAAVK